MVEKEIFEYINSVLTKEYIESCINKNEIFGLSAKEIADYFNIYRSTVSALLNSAVKNKSFIKINTRPVLFAPRSVLEDNFNISLTKQEYTKDEIRDLFFLNNKENSDPFSILIGYDGSQAFQVKQSQSAVLYPPKGLHTLITGESGTGKTLFAHAMYNYGKAIQGKSENEYPFVEFNCADYYHNPQLLLSQLFGHIRGAFTGAEKETSGLVEKANHGILFLDEIHRLPPEGQELLFYLMDSGQYRKMGEANTTRKADVLIIGATTENPNNVLLKTFKRRIPLSIQLPPLRERPIIERLKLIEHLLSNEANITQRTYIIDSNIIKAMTVFDFPENIGQLSSEIKILCARSFLENKNENSSEIQIPYRFLSEDIKKYYESKEKDGYNFLNELENYNYDLKVTPLKEISILKERYLDAKAYNVLINEIGTYSSQGLSRKQVAEKISSVVADYYNDILKQTSFKTIDKNEINKIIEPEIVDFSIQLMNDVKNQLQTKVSEQNVLILAFHLKFLIDRLKKSKQQEPSGKTGDSIVDEMISKIESTFNIFLPEDEKNFFYSLIRNISDKTKTEANENSKAALYILAHGNTASSIADVCNRLLQTNSVKSFDMPLTQDVQTSYNLFLQEIKMLHPTNGIMILADMGSLLTFGKKITQDTGISTHTIPNVSTALALDFAHIMLNRNEHVDITYNEYLIKNQKNKNINESNKPLAIISTCSSGKGTSMAFKESIEELLNENQLTNITVIALMNQQIQHNEKEFADVLKNYNILAIVGNIHVDTKIPFFHITELLTKEKRTHFIDFITKSSQKSQSQNNSNNKNGETNNIIKFLSKHVLYVNPFSVEKYGTRFLNTTFQDLKYSSDDLETLEFSLKLHIGFMLERIITNKNILFDNKDEFINNHKKSFNIIRKDIKIIEDPFEIKVSDDEICYILMTLYPEEKS